MQITKFYPSHDVVVRDTKWGWYFACSRCGHMDPEDGEVCKVVTKSKTTNHNCKEEPFKQHDHFRVCLTCGCSYTNE